MPSTPLAPPRAWMLGEAEMRPGGLLHPTPTGIAESDPDSDSGPWASHTLRVWSVERFPCQCPATLPSPHSGFRFQPRRLAQTCDQVGGHGTGHGHGHGHGGFLPLEHSCSLSCGLMFTGHFSEATTGPRQVSLCLCSQLYPQCPNPLQHRGTRYKWAA